jgi:anaerobic selenocysteine-containing dehydrogenase
MRAMHCASSISLVISDNVRATDTIGAGPHVLLPAAAWGEKDGAVTNSERRISRQRAFLPAAGEAQPDWWAVSEVAKRMGFGAAFDYSGPAAIFREHAALSTARARIGALVHPFTDLYSGQPDSKSIPAAVAPICFAAHGFVLARRRLPLPGDTFFAWSAIEGGFAARFAANETFATLFEALAARSPSAEQATYNDPAKGMFRAALIEGGKLDAVLFLGAGGRRAALEWSCRSLAAGTARRHRATLSPGGQKRVRRLRRKPHNLRVLWREIAGHLGGDRRWRMFDRCDWEVPKRRDELRFVSA